MNCAEVIQVTRQELYERVWSTPMRTLAAEWGLSDVGLAKICKKHQIPRPGPGHWAKKRHGKRSCKARLPTIHDEQLSTISITVVDRVGDPDIVDPEIARLILKETDPEQIITVGKRVQLRHPLVKATRTSLNGSQPDKYGRVNPQRSFSGVHFIVSVSPKNVSRALRILQVLTSSMLARGYVLKESSSHRDSHPHFDVLGEKFTVTIREGSKRSERDDAKKESKHDWWYGERYDYTPTGILELCLNFSTYSSVATLRDTIRKPLDNRLNEAIVSMLKIVAQRRQAAELAHVKAIAKADRKRIAIEQEIERRSDTTRINAMKLLATQLETYQRLNAFVNAVRIESESQHTANDCGTKIWLTWADGYLRDIDPLCGGRNLPVYALTDDQRESLHAECSADWVGYAEVFREHK